MKKILLFLFINFFTFFVCPQQETKRIVSEWTLDKTKILEKEYFYDFNYIISNTKITPEIWKNSDANKINNVFCRSFFVSFSLIDKSKTYYEDF